MIDLDKWRLNVLRAIEAQANDPTLWTEETVHEAYLNQSLRWLHKVIEENDLVALNNILNQAADLI